MAGNDADNLVTFSLTKGHNLHYLPSSAFNKSKDTAIVSSSSLVSSQRKNDRCIDVKKIIGLVHRPVCGHTEFSYIKLLLQQNNKWYDEVKHSDQKLYLVAANVVLLHSLNRPEWYH